MDGFGLARGSSCYITGCKNSGMISATTGTSRGDIVGSSNSVTVR